MDGLEPNYKIVLNIDGIENMYHNNELINVSGLKPLKIEGGKTKINTNPFKFNTSTTNNCNICYVINCYIVDNMFNNSSKICKEIINIIQQYKKINITEFKQKLKKYLKIIISYCKTSENIKTLKNPYNIEILYTKHNGGIYNNRNKFIYNINDICEYDSKTNDFKFPYVLMLDDSDFSGFKFDSKILKTLDECYKNDKIWSIGTASTSFGPGHISFWERIYKTKFLNKFINLPGDINDDGRNKEFSKNYEKTDIGHCFEINEQWCDYGSNSNTKTTVHLNPPPIFIYENKLNSYNNINLKFENYSSKVFDYNDKNELSILNYILQRYYIVINKNYDKETTDIIFEDIDLTSAEDFIEMNDGSYFVNLSSSMGRYKNIIEKLQSKNILNENYEINENYKLYAYPKDLYSKLRTKSTTTLEFKRIPLTRDDVYFKIENAYYIRVDESLEMKMITLKTLFILRKFKNSALLCKNKREILRNAVFRTLGGCNFSNVFKFLYLIIIIIMIVITVIILILHIRH